MYQHRCLSSKRNRPCIAEKIGLKLEGCEPDACGPFFCCTMRFIISPRIKSQSAHRSNHPPGLGPRGDPLRGKRLYKLEGSYPMSTNLKPLSPFSLGSSRISPSEALALLQHAHLADLMTYAHKARCHAHGRNVHFVHSLNLNPTNICENQCGLCAFWRDRDSEEANLTIRFSGFRPRRLSCSGRPQHLLPFRSRNTCL